MKPALSVADLLLLGVAAIWGSSYAVAKEAVALMPVLQFLALRFGLTFLVLLPALRPLRHAPARQGLAAAGLLGANLLAIFVCETFGVSLTRAANAAFLIGLCVALTPLAEWAILGRRPRTRLFVAAAVSALGAALLAASSPLDVSAGRGDALMLAAAVLRAVFVSLTKRLTRAHRMPALTLTALQCGVLAVGAGVLSLATTGGHWTPLPASGRFWAAMAWLVLACSVFAFFVQNHAVVRSSPSRVALLLGCEPLFGAVGAAALLGERVAASGWAGGALIVLAAGWVSWPSAPAREGLAGA